MSPTKASGSVYRTRQDSVLGPPGPLVSNREGHRGDSAANASHAEGLPGWVAGVQGAVALCLRDGQDRALFCSQALAGAQERERKEEMGKSVAQVFCVMGAGGRPGVAQEVSSTRRGRSRRPESADGFRGGGRPAASWWLGGYLTFCAHFMSSARGFSPVRPWMRSSRRLQKPTFSRG